MYQSPASFEALLDPRSYCAEDLSVLEATQVFESTWQFVGLVSSIDRPGQYLSATIGNVPVLVRNFDGEFAVVRNVCAHRHCALVTATLGQSAKLNCPFHGWEYGSDGRTRRIPAAKNFPDFDRERYRLSRFLLEQCGDLMFVRIRNEGPSLKEWLGSLFERFAEWTSPPDWKPAVSRRLTFPANWKIPVEGSLESYHIPAVHPQTFAEDPGELKSEHAFATYSSSFFTSFNTPRFRDRVLKAYEKFILTILGVTFTGRYEHHHVFPNLLVSHTDSLTLVQSVRPLTSQTSEGLVWQFGRQSRRRNPASRLTAYGWSRFTAWLAYQVLKEDIGIYPQIQRGECSAVENAVLGRCEERLHAFQKFVVECGR